MTTPTPWWYDAVGYEIYLRSFADADGDGIGDLAGVTSRLDHLVELGVEVVWITPFYTSPMVDYGYDVADYCGVDPTFGDLDDVAALIAAAHERDLRVVVDIVPNHCSSEHEWFADARTGRDSAHRDYFIWRDPAPDGGPPNNWVGYFGGSAWTLDEASGQYYLHLFLPEQPDLNWRNPAVRDEFDAILRFWLDRGVDGFRIDVAQALMKDEQLRSNPELSPWNPDGARWEQWDAFDHQHDVGQPESLEIFARWRAIAEEYDAVLIGETYVLEADELSSMLSGDGLHVGFWFKPMHIEWDAAALRATLSEPLQAVSDPRSIGWVASSHDEVRPPTRFGGGDVGRRRSLAFTTVLLSLPGMPFLYQGEELGLTEGVVPEDRKADPVGADVTLSRDGCRTPIPWSPGPAFGFSSTTETWLPDGGRSDADTVEVQRQDPTSWFSRYRALVALRRSEPDLRHAPLEWIEMPVGSVIAFRRGRFVIALNAGAEAVELPVRGTPVFDTAVGAPASATVPGQPLTLGPDAAVVIAEDPPK